ncbi:hypothetical protein CFR78_04230 [Komagataeibacter rhaeticus]|uniref:hypothetical protein n=1 Tax=Komagataeibacter rhaeticus TaxID=215221 RepID=UPI0004D47BC6|nr:hypothetical protein [Komagataeibacter rhaeticus]KDU96459.1 hypothetical protein GLUCORHAEAF1_01700 [Komagataeibacter rhaeticus AF1]PYD54183.1 hypothetical protein CFR78_04230 [Komagataeibacter rhaeticus]GBQ15249.1 hypothetical protein AA16663_2034 [Komagataeibacter rhaeticus DSM 16663]
MELPENQYPRLLLYGGPIVEAFMALRQRLREAFPPDIFRHIIVPPNAKRATWERLLTTKPVIGLAWNAWKPHGDCGATFRGDLVFAVFIAVQHADSGRLYVGVPGSLRGMGAMGAAGAATAFLHARPLSGELGTPMVRMVALPPTADWLADDVGLVSLEVTVPNVSFDGPALAQQLDDFKGLRETWQDADGDTLVAPPPQTGETA